MIHALDVLGEASNSTEAQKVAAAKAQYEKRRLGLVAKLASRFPNAIREGNSTDQMAWNVIGEDNGFPIFGIVFRVGRKIYAGAWNGKRPLLSANSKLRKLPGRAKRFRAIGLAMAPAAYSGKDLCAWRTAGCTAACNGFWSGMNVTISTRLALIGRALLFNWYRDLFESKLRRELTNYSKLCKRLRLIPCCRLNVSTDVVYERLASWLFLEFTMIRFLDYTKALPKHRMTLPANYELCHSFNEKTTTEDVESIVSAGRNVVIAFDSAYAPSRGLWGSLPKYVRFTDSTGRDFTLPVVNGDRHDLRLACMDGRGVVIGLHGKSGRSKVEKAVESGFMIHNPAGAKLRKVSRFEGTVVIARDRPEACRS